MHESSKKQKKQVEESLKMEVGFAIERVAAQVSTHQTEIVKQTREQILTEVQTSVSQALDAVHNRVCRLLSTLRCQQHHQSSDAGLASLIHKTYRTDGYYFIASD